MSSVRHIAKEAGVSITTVSRVLNNHPRVSRMARDKVLAAANDLRYVATTGKRSTTNIALLYTGESSLGSGYDATLMWGMSKGLETHGYDLMVLDANRSRRTDETFSQMFMRKGVRGAIVRTTIESRQTCLTLADEGFPAVVIGDRFDRPDIHSAFADSREPSREAVEHLISQGHRRIAISLNVVDDSDHTDRLEGYRSALQDHGIEVDRKLILRCPAHREGGTQLMRRIASMGDRPTAVFITDPASAAGAMKEARAMGVQIPRDLSVVGFDDGEMRYDLTPEMTCVCQDTGAIGREALEALHQLIESGPNLTPPARLKVRAWLEVHASTAPPPPGESA